MKRSSISIVLLSLFMTSCSIMVQASKPIFSETLFNELKQGIKIQSKVSEKINNQTNVYLMQNTMKYKELSMIKFKDATDSEVVLENAFLGKDEDNFVYTIRLNMNNELIYNKNIDNKGEAITWSNGYINPFSLLNYTDFSSNKNNYTLSATALEKSGVRDGFSYLFYGNPGINITSVDLMIEDNKISLSAVGDAASQNINYTFEGLIINYGSNVEIDYYQSPFTGESDEDFRAMLTALRTNNYTATIHDNDEDKRIEEKNIFYSNPDKLFFDLKNGTEKKGYYALSTGGIQEIDKEGNTYYKAGDVMEKSLDDFRSYFPISPLCFNKNDNVYTIKDKIKGDLRDILPIEMLVPEINNFTITINEDEYVFKNINGEKSTTIVFSNVGNTVLDFSEETVLDPVKVTWEDVLGNEVYSIAEIIGAENLKQLPVPTWYWNKEWDVIIDDEVAYIMAYYETDNIEEDLENYGLQLIDAGYSKLDSEGNLDPSGKIYAKESQINNETKTIAIEPYQSFGFFSIGIYILK